MFSLASRERGQGAEENVSEELIGVCEHVRTQSWRNYEVMEKIIEVMKKVKAGTGIRLCFARSRSFACN